MTAGATDWPARYAVALEAAGGDGLGLTEPEVDAVLDLARDVAHGTERRYAPLSTFLAGRFVAQRVAAGVPEEAALAEARAIAERLLDT